MQKEVANGWLGSSVTLPRTQSLAIILLHHPQHCGFSTLNSSPHGHKMVAVVPAIKLSHNTTCSRMEEKVANGALPPHACLYIRAGKLSQNLLNGRPVWFIGQNWFSSPSYPTSQFLIKETELPRLAMVFQLSCLVESPEELLRSPNNQVPPLDQLSDKLWEWDLGFLQFWKDSFPKWFLNTAWVEYHWRT